MSLFRRTEVRMAADSVPWTPIGSGGDALSLIPLYAAVDRIATTAATLPLHAYTRSAGGRRRLDDLPQAIGGMAWRMAGFTSILLHGNAVGVLSLDHHGRPIDCRWISPARVQVIEATKGAPRRWLIDGQDVDEAYICHVPGFTRPGKTWGLSPVAAFRVTIEGGQEAQAGSRDWAKNRQIPSVIMKNSAQTITPEAADAVSARLRQKLRTGYPFTHGKDWAVEITQAAASDVAFLASIRATATQIATIYAIPPEMIGGETGQSMTYQTVEQQALHFLSFTVRPWLARFEEALSAKLAPPSEYLRWSTDGLIRTDTQTRYEVHRISRQIGLRSIDEIRELEDLPPLPDGQGSSYAPLALTKQQGDTTR